LKIALIGALANDKTAHWVVGIAADDESAVSVLEGLQKYGNKLSYVKGADVSVELNRLGD
jgi:beta-glucosidase